jgi:hypothetical protein
MGRGPGRTGRDRVSPAKGSHEIILCPYYSGQGNTRFWNRERIGFGTNVTCRIDEIQSFGEVSGLVYLHVTDAFSFFDVRVPCSFRVLFLALPRDSGGSERR